jgi:hypothetical protein
MFSGHHVRARIKNGTVHSGTLSYDELRRNLVCVQGLLVKRITMNYMFRDLRNNNLTTN